MATDDDDEMRRLCRISYTIMSAVWLGRKSPAEKAAWERKKAADARAVDGILAGRPPTKAERQGFLVEDGGWAARQAAERARKERLARRTGRPGKRASDAPSPGAGHSTEDRA